MSCGLPVHGRLPALIALNFKYNMKIDKMHRGGSLACWLQPPSFVLVGGYGVGVWRGIGGQPLGALTT